MGFGERLRVAIEQSGQSIRGLSRELEQRRIGGASYPAIDRYLKGKGEPDVTWLREAAAILGFNVEWLAAGTGPARPGQTIERDVIWAQMTPSWLPGDPLVEILYRRVVQRALASGKTLPRDFWERLEDQLLAPFALFAVEIANLPPGHVARAFQMLLLGFDAVIPPTAADRLAAVTRPAAPTGQTTTETPKRTKRPKKGRTTHTARKR
jgi:hypothetical protein